MGRPNRSKGTNLSSRKAVARPPKKDSNNEDTLMTSPKSKLINVDLISFLSDPQTIALLTDAEKTDILANAAENLGLDPANIPNDIFKHNNDFKGAVRQFQEDLASGKCDPLWIEQAALAMEERAAGKFDAWKEKEFEEFWGQKQKLDHTVIAGESAKLKLDVLLKNNYFKVGDEWSYSRGFGRGGEKLLVEKDATIIRIGDGQLTFAIAPGRQKYAKLGQAPAPADYAELDSAARRIVDTMVGRPGGQDAKVKDGKAMTIMTSRHHDQNDMDDVEMIDAIAVGNPGLDQLGDVQEGNKGSKLDPGHESNLHDVERTEEDTMKGSYVADTTNVSSDGKPVANDPIRTEESASHTKLEAMVKPSPNGTQIANGHQSTPACKTREASPTSEVSAFSRTPSLEPSPPACSGPTKGKTPKKLPRKTPTKTEMAKTALPSTSPTLQIYTLDLKSGNSLGALETAILKIDGRVPNPPNGNAWKAMRCRRKNQDMGTLFEIREEYYVWKLGGTSGRVS